MRIRLNQARFGRLLGIVATAAVFAVPAAHAFTMQDGSDGATTAPKFDLEEQARQFRTPDASAFSGAGNTQKFELPNGGTLQFSTRSYSTFSSPFGFTSSGAAERQHMDRMFDPQFQLQNNR